ncbi:hypothetical protein CU098_002041, partial [Rhizopus stolonifer]
KPSSDKNEEAIKRLKGFINKCGVRKVWSRELKDCKSARAEIEKLKSMLQELGVDGRPTNEKCEAVKKERELKAEFDSLDASNIINNEEEESSGRRTRRRNVTQKAVYKFEESSEEEEEEEREEEKNRGGEEEEEEEGEDEEEEEEEEDESSEDEFKGSDDDDE